MGVTMNTMNIHGVTRITVGEPTVLDVHGGVHTRVVTIEHKGATFDITLFGSKVVEGEGPVKLRVEDDCVSLDMYREACDDLATLCAERDELAGKLERAQDVVESLLGERDVYVRRNIDLELDNERLRQEVDRLHDKVREGGASA